MEERSPHLDVALRGAARPRTDNDGRAVGRRPGWIGPGREGGRRWGSGEGRHLRNFSLFREPPAISRQDAEGDATAAFVIGFAGWEKKSSTQFGGRHGTRGPIHGACSDWTGLTSRTRERKLLCGQAQFFMAGRPGSPLLAPSPLAPQQLELMFERDGLALARLHLSSRHSWFLTCDEPFIWRAIFGLSHDMDSFCLATTARPDSFEHRNRINIKYDVKVMR